MTAPTVIFLVASFLLLHTYILYPLILHLMGKPGRELRTASQNQPGDTETLQAWPMVSVVIPFHNEKQWAARKLENSLSCDYPADRLEVIAVSDGSLDTTNDILDGYKGRVHVTAYHPRRGKATALNLGVEQSRGEILIFTDANVLVEPKAIQAIIASYNDPTVGGVSGKVVLQPEGAGEPLGEGVYMRYEQWLYRLESNTQTMVGADGAFFSIRRELYSALPPDTFADDLCIALQVIGKGKRLVYEPTAYGIEMVKPNVRAEFSRKARMIAGGYQALGRFRHLLNPFRFPLVAFQLVSHKLLRWWAPFFLVALFVSSVLNSTHAILFAAALAAQCAFYGLAVLGWRSVRLRRWRLAYVPYYFCATNLAAVHGAWRFLQGRQTATWHKVVR